MTQANNNAAATADSIQALRKQGRLGREHDALVEVAKTLAQALDDAAVDSPARRYTIPSIAKELRAALHDLGAHHEAASSPWTAIEVALAETMADPE